jgi:hypothetical protein
MRARAVHNSLTLRLRLLKARLRTVVVDQDILGLGCTAFMMTDSDRVVAFSHCIKTLVAQVFAGFLKDTAVAEVEMITGSLEMVLARWIANDCIMRQ